MKKVLIAVDYDPAAQKIAEEGYALARSIGAQAILLHVISDYFYFQPITFSNPLPANLHLLHSL